MTEFADLRLGKGVVIAKDTPGFVANRIGAFWMQSAVVAAQEMGLTIEEADAIVGRPRSEEHTSELQSLMRISYAVFCLKKKRTIAKTHNPKDGQSKRTQ